VLNQLRLQVVFLQVWAVAALVAQQQVSSLAFVVVLSGAALVCQLVFWWTLLWQLQAPVFPISQISWALFAVSLTRLSEIVWHLFGQPWDDPVPFLTWWKPNWHRLLVLQCPNRHQTRHQLAVIVRQLLLVRWLPTSTRPHSPWSCPAVPALTARAPSSQTAHWGTTPWVCGSLYSLATETGWPGAQASLLPTPDETPASQTVSGTNWSLWMGGSSCCTQTQALSSSCELT